MRARAKTARFAAILGILGLAGLLSPGVLLTGRAALPQTGASADGMWLPVASRGVLPAPTISVDGPSAVVALDREVFEEAAEARPAGGSAVWTLPMPDGSFTRVRVRPAPVLADELAAAAPEIRTFALEGIDDATMTGRLGWTALGFHAMLLSASGTIRIDPYTDGRTDLYLSFRKADARPTDSGFRCLVDGDALAVAAAARPLDEFPISHGETLRTYRLALAATGEYTIAAGGTKTLALARMVATMNRVNGIFEREIAARLIVSTGPAADATALIYTNPASDPYTNSDVGKMLAEHQTNADAVIGAANYDIGHVFGTEGGGVAGLRALCTTGFKAWGATGLTNPTGETFDVDYVSHELGHQFGANHTFNTASGGCSTNRNASTAFEVGSGVTIMGYAYVCPAEKLQAAKEDDFHVSSINEMTAHITGAADSCSQKSATGNRVPVIEPLSEYTIPRNTPFALTAVASDPNFDALIYAWEQYDLGTASTSTATASTDDGSRPLFRWFQPSANPVRIFPSLTYILNNANEPPQTYNCSGQTCLTGEALPSTARTMNFRLTVRDTVLGGAALASAATKVHVRADAGPFAITIPSNPGTWSAGQQQFILWDVAGTAGAPISVANVRLTMSFDGGQTWPAVLAASTPNDGTHLITVPAQATTQGRVRVEAIGNIFFDVNNSNITVSSSSANTAPIVTITGPTSAATFSTAADGLVFSGTATDNIGIAGVTWSSSRGAAGSATGTTAWSVPVPLELGSNVITITASDGSLTASDTITVTRTAATFSATPATWAAPVGGGTQAVTVTASASDTAWTASSDQSWLTLSAPGGTGSGSVTLTAAANTTTQARAATVTVAGQSVAVTQAGATPEFSLSASSVSASAAGAQPQLTVTSSHADAVWDAVTAHWWLEPRTLRGVSTFAGGLTTHTDGTGPLAGIPSPGHVALDRNGNLYVVGQNAIRKITPAGVVTTLAGNPAASGYQDGTGSAALFTTSGGSGIAVDAAGNVFVADQSNNRIRKITPAGVVTTYAGSSFGYADHATDPLQARFRSPAGLACDTAGNLYVVDNGNFRIRKITPGGAVSTIAGAGTTGSADGNAALATFGNLNGIAVDAAGVIYLADSSNHRIRKIADGVVSTVAGSTQGATDGTGTAAQFNFPVAVTIDFAGNLLVADRNNHRLRRILPSGEVQTVAGSTAGFADHTSGTSAAFNQPGGVAATAAGDVIVSDALNQRVRRWMVAGGLGTTEMALAVQPNPSAYARTGTVTIAGRTLTVTQAGATGTATVTPASWSVPAGGGSQSFTQTTSIPDLPMGGQISANWITISRQATSARVAGGAGAASGSADGPGAAARFLYPRGLAVDRAGRVYIADASNHAIRVMSLTGQVTTLAGGSLGAAEGSGKSAQFHFPFGLAVDTEGFVYVADSDNHRVRKVNGRTGAVSTLAGSSAGFANGTGAAAMFNHPNGVAVDAGGNVYVADSENHQVRKVTPAGVVTTLAGASTPGTTDGIGADARFSYPTALAIDTSAQLLYVSDVGSCRIRRITLSGVPGVVSTVAGSTCGNLDGPAASAQIGAVTGLAPAGSGAVYLADASNHRLRFLNGAGVVSTLAGAGAGNADGSLTDARYDNPAAVVLDQNFLVHLADQNNHRVVRVNFGAVGSGTITLTAAATTSAKTRSGSVTLGPAPAVTVTQAAGTPVFTLDASAASVGAAQSTGTVTLSSSFTDADWTASSSASWLTITSGSSGTGNGTIVYSVAAATTVAQRQGTLTIAGLTYTVTQAGGTASFSLDPASASVNAAGGTGSVAVTSAMTDSSWTAASNASWITVTSGASGTGGGSVAYSAAATTSAASRQGTITIAGQTFTLTQAAGQPSFTVSPASWAAPAAGGTRQVEVSASLADAGWTASADAAWLTVSAAGATGTGSITLTASANSGGSARSATATIAGQSVLVTQVPLTGTLTVSPGTLLFAGTNNAGTLGPITAPQTVTVTIGGGATVTWSAAADQPWVQIANGSGRTGTGAFQVAIVNPSNVLGSTTSATATITLSATNVSNPPPAVPLKLTLSAATALQAPFGQVDTPAQDAAGVVGAVAVTGWALDDVGVSSVKIYRNCLPFEPQANCQTVLGQPVVFVGDAAFLAGARPDVEAAFATHPQSNRGGWGYLMLTPMLPHVTGRQPYGGQGALTLYAVATDVEGNATMLGRSSNPADASFAAPTTITMANDTIAKPFGAIDTPSQGQTVSGSLANFGWALTPDGNTIADGTDILIPTNGSTMFVFIDGAPVAPVSYNQCRGTVGNPVPSSLYCNDDVSNIFGNLTPQPSLQPRGANPTRHRNLDAGRAPIGSYVINTTTLSNGLHTIAWSVTDSAGRNEGIGSRFFNVLNSGSRSDAMLREAPAAAVGDARTLPPPAEGAVRARTGFDLSQPWMLLTASGAGARGVGIPELGRVELWLGDGVTAGYLRVGDELRPLPPGSRLKNGLFTWAPAAGYLGTYELVFVTDHAHLPVTVTIGGK